MNDPILISRFQFAFTIAYHYLFPQFTMGLAFLIVIMKSLYLWKKREIYNKSVRFWSRIFAVSFIIGVVTGIPMEFQFGTNWAQFSSYAGNIIAQTLAMEGAFAFFLESAFVGLLLFGERTFGQRVHLFSAVMVWMGTWASGYFIITSNAWMQHPIGYTMRTDGSGVEISDYWAILTNSWAAIQYMHTMSGAVITGSFAVAGLGAFYLLSKRDIEYARFFVTVGVIVGFMASFFQLLPSGDLEGRQVADHQPVKLASMEGLFRTERGAGIAILGQPDMQKQTLDNPLVVPKVLSFLTYRRWEAVVRGLNEFPRNLWPDNVPLVYYSYHIMVGLGTFFIAIMGFATLLLVWQRRLFTYNWMLWILMLAVPFPFIANTAGWFTAETGRQPWIIYGLLRTSDGVSSMVSSSNVLFTLIGFAGMYSLMWVLYIVLIVKHALEGPEASDHVEEMSSEYAG